ncbi:MAG: cation:proton antiporter [Phascolarctobacterium sp.]|nr:cation:proton antiporter [Phascolarctobacterium sp.]
MSHLPTIITDLAMILLVAGVTTILFKKINQPLVLGYIVAGFITGPNFSFFPTITDSVNVQSWSEIGVIFLLFALGLEFSFYKLKKVGSTAFIATAVEILGMLAMGYFAGTLLGWNHMDSLFLGGMLSMSSTTIIIKAFDDLNLRGQSFTEVVFGILIVEDIAGIVMMVMLSTMAVATSGISSVELLMSIGRLGFFLILWFVLGMYLVPSFFKWAQNLMNDETLVVVSIGLCLGMVYLATHLGFSSALGAFIMGSLIAEAPNAEHIEHLVAPIKDLFGAVFFVSVGMMVNPALLVEHWLPILVLVIATIGGKLFFSTSGVLASAHSLNTSVHCGFALAQIGEFSFIIASLGMSLGVISEFIYPIIVAVSVITTFTTPFCIMQAEPAYQSMLKLLPPKLITWLVRYTDSDIESSKGDQDWKNLLTSYVLHMVIYVTLLFAIMLGSSLYLLPYLKTTLELPYANLIAAGLTLLVMAPILRAVLVNRAGNAELFSILWFKRRANHLPLLILVFGKVLVASSSLYFVFNDLVGLHGLLACAAIVVAVYFIASSDWLMGEYLRIESRFLVNLNEKHMRKHRESEQNEVSSAEQPNWFDEELVLASYHVADDSPIIGKSMKQLGVRQYYGCNVLQIRKGPTTIDMPGGEQVVSKDNSLLLIGTASQLKILDAAIIQRHLKLHREKGPLTLRQFMLENHASDEQDFLSLAITIDKHSPLLGKSLKALDLRQKWSCLVIGLERGAFTITNPNVSLVFEENDLLWVLGKQKMMNTLIREEIL